MNRFWRVAAIATWVVAPLLLFHNLRTYASVGDPSVIWESDICQGPGKEGQVFQERPTCVYAESFRVTYYLPTGNPMYTGHRTFRGAAAVMRASELLPHGTIFQIEGWPQIYVALDTGELTEAWVDVFVKTREEGIELMRALSSGGRAQIRVLQWP